MYADQLYEGHVTCHVTCHVGGYGRSHEPFGVRVDLP